MYEFSKRDEADGGGEEADWAVRSVGTGGDSGKRKESEGTQWAGAPPDAAGRIANGNNAEETSHGTWPPAQRG